METRKQKQHSSHSFGQLWLIVCVRLCVNSLVYLPLIGKIKKTGTEFQIYNDLSIKMTSPVQPVNQHLITM